MTSLLKFLLNYKRKKLILHIYGGYKTGNMFLHLFLSFVEDEKA